MANRREERERRRREQERLRRERLAAQAAAERAARRKRLIASAGGFLAVAAIVAVVVAVGGGKGSGGTASSSSPAPVGNTSGLPAQIAANLRQGNLVIDDSLQSKLAALKGVPVVVNQWASWCPNCKAEFGFFQRLSQRYRNRVAFLGDDAQDQRGNAAAFLKEHPVNNPSVFDHDASQAQSIGAGQAWPTTLYFDRDGRVTFVRPGGYVTLESLDGDIRQHALGQ